MAPTPVPKAAVELVKRHEGLRLEAYLCPAGVCTIGYGHTGPDVKMGQRITKAEAERLLREDMRWATDLVDTRVKVHLSQPQRCALISFAFNVGEGAFGSSTLLKKLNAGDYAAVPAQMARWNKAKVKGKLTVLPGLVTRRAEEAALFQQDDAPEVDAMPQAVEAPEAGAKPMGKSLTVQGGTIAGVGAVCTEATTQIQPLVDYSGVIRLVFVVLTLLGVALALYGRYRLRKSEGV